MRILYSSTGNNRFADQHDGEYFKNLRLIYVRARTETFEYL